MINNKYTVKVNLVTTLEQTLELDKLGVDLIGIPIWNDEIYDGGPYGNIKTIENNELIKISKEFDKSKLVGCFWINRNESELIKYFKFFDYMQQQAPYDLYSKTKKKIFNANKKLVFGNINVDDDTDPSWIISRYLCSDYTWATFYEINLLGDITNSRNYFKQLSSEYPNELQIEDINALGRIYPIVISLDFDENNILEILEKIPNTKGIALTIDNNDLVNIHGIQVQSYEKIIKLLKYLQNLNS